MAKTLFSGHVRSVILDMSVNGILIAVICEKAALMHCSYHIESFKKFIASGERVNWDKCCDTLGCFSFHPSVNPDFLDKEENIAYIKKNKVRVWRNLTKKEIDELDKTRS